MDRKEAKKQEEAIRKQKLELSRCVNVVGRTTEGKKLLRWIKNYSGYGKTSMVLNPETQEINQVGVVYNEARKDVYYALRSYFDSDVLRAIEFKEENDV